LIIGAAAALLLSGGAADESGAQNPLGIVIDFSEAELRMILQHGPWPPPPARDPSNRVSGKAEAIEFGERLFFDPRLSATGTVSCATCHVPEKGWTDGRKLAVGLAEVDRNTPTVQNVRLHRWFGWDGANDNLWSQSVRPMLDAREMGATERHVAGLIRNDADLACRHEKVFGGRPSPARAIAACATSARISPTASSTRLASPFSRRRAAWTGGATRGSSGCARTG
jgi:cytochrome c peroxidase